jgi:mono/diheme cytochrome c family protein
VAEHIEEFDAMNADEIEAQLAGDADDDRPTGSDLYNYAVNYGADLPHNCSQCHGSGAAGVQGLGYPNLLDDDWLWGGTIETIAYTIRHGIRNDRGRWTTPITRRCRPSATILTDEEITNVVQYVRNVRAGKRRRSLSNWAVRCSTDNCAACHMEDGTGDQFQGAPNLTDAIWLMPPYGSAVFPRRRSVRSPSTFTAWVAASRPRQGSGSPSRLPDRHRSRSCSRVSYGTGAFPRPPRLDPEAGRFSVPDLLSQPMTWPASIDLRQSVLPPATPKTKLAQNRRFSTQG